MAVWVYSSADLLDWGLNKGHCGNGPNLIIFPEEVVISHIGTVAKMTELLKQMCDVHVSPDRVAATQVLLKNIGKNGSSLVTIGRE